MYDFNLLKNIHTKLPSMYFHARKAFLMSNISSLMRMERSEGYISGGYGEGVSGKCREERGGRSPFLDNCYARESFI